MNYHELDIHARINLKGTYEAFLKIAVQKFQKSQEEKIYGRRRKKNYGRSYTPTRGLQRDFKTHLNMSGSSHVLSIDFRLYGRFVDMGVGRGTNLNTALLRKRYRAHRDATNRKPIRWYSKTKASQEKRLAEIMAKRYSIGLVKMAENALNNTFTLPLT